MTPARFELATNSLKGYCSTIELRSRARGHFHGPQDIQPHMAADVLRARGIEPLKAGPSDLQSDPFSNSVNTLKGAGISPA